MPADVYADDYRRITTERLNTTLFAPDLRPIPNRAGDAPDCRVSHCCREAGQTHTPRICFDALSIQSTEDKLGSTGESEASCEEVCESGDQRMVLTLN